MNAALVAAAVVGIALMFVLRGHWVLWGICLAATAVALGGLGWSIGRARE